MSPTGVEFTSLPGHPEGVGRGISFRFVDFEGTSYLKIEAWGAGSFLTEAPVVSSFNYAVARGTWDQLAANLRGR